MSIVVGQPLGATAKPDKGQIEVFIQRKMKGVDKGGIGEPLDKWGELSYKFKTKFDKGTPLEQLYDQHLVRIIAIHQTDLLISVTNEAY